MRNGIRETAARQNNFVGALEQAARHLTEGAPVESRPAWRKIAKSRTLISLPLRCGLRQAQAAQSINCESNGVAATQRMFSLRGQKERTVAECVGDPLRVWPSLRWRSPVQRSSRTPIPNFESEIARRVSCSLPAAPPRRKISARRREWRWRSISSRAPAARR